MQDQAILPVHVVGMELHLQCLTDELVHAAGFGGEDFGALELDVTILVEYVHCHCQTGWMCWRCSFTLVSVDWPIHPL
jgi:hypothetical protein